MVLTNYKAKNNASTTLASGISAGATSMIVATGAGALFPSTYPFLMTLEQFTGDNVTKREIVKCTSRTGDTFTIVRSAGYCPADYTALTQTNTAFAFSTGDTVSLRIVSEIVDDINAELARLETDKLNVTDYQNGTKVYASTSTGNDSYAITLSPALGAYAVGQCFKFLSDVGNTGPATLNINGLGAKTIKKLRDQDLATGDIEASQIVTVSYDGTNFQMDSQVATIPTIDIDGQTEKTTLADLDEFIIYDVAGGANKKLKKSTLNSYIRGQQTYTLGESMTGATTPHPCIVVNDIAQVLVAGCVRLGTVSSGSNYAKERAIKFIPRSNVTSTTVVALLAKNNTPGDNIFCTIQGDNAGSPNGTPITNGTSNDVVGNDLSASVAAPTTFTFASAFTLTADTTYWLVFDRDGSDSDTNHYFIGTYTDDQDYASFDSKSYVSNWNNASLELLYFKIVPSSGSGSKSLWKADANHACELIRNFTGFCITSGNAGDDGTYIRTGVVPGFSGLIPYVEYTLSQTAGEIGIGNFGMVVGEAISATELQLTEHRTGNEIELGVITSSYFSSPIVMGGVVWEVPYDGDFVLTTRDGTAVTNLTIIVCDNTNMSTGAIEWHTDEYSNGLRSTVTIPVRKGKYLKCTNSGAGTKYCYFIPRY